MHTHQFTLTPHNLELIKEGKKTIEVRVADPKRKMVRRGDYITFNNTITCIVLRVAGYLSFEEMLEHENPDTITQGQTKTHIIESLRNIYSQEKEDLGVLVFHLQVDP